MSKYIPMTGPLPGVQWHPSNGSNGYSFLEDWCRHCARDKAMREGADYDECDDDECCPIIAASFRGEAVEWREIDGDFPTCLAFVPAGEPVPPEPDTLTPDLFGEPATDRP